MSTPSPTVRRNPPRQRQTPVYWDLVRQATTTNPHGRASPPPADGMVNAYQDMDASHEIDAFGDATGRDMDVTGRVIPESEPEGVAGDITSTGSTGVNGASTANEDVHHEIHNSLDRGANLDTSSETYIEAIPRNHTAEEEGHNRLVKKLPKARVMASHGSRTLSSLYDAAKMNNKASHLASIIGLAFVEPTPLTEAPATSELTTTSSSESTATPMSLFVPVSSQATAGSFGSQTGPSPPVREPLFHLPPARVYDSDDDEIMMLAHQAPDPDPMAMLFIAIDDGATIHSFVVNGPLHASVTEITLSQVVSILRNALQNPQAPQHTAGECLGLLEAYCQSTDAEYMLGRSFIPRKMSDANWCDNRSGFRELGTLRQCLDLEPASTTIAPTRRCDERSVLLMDNRLRADARLYAIYVYPKPFDHLAQADEPVGPLPVDTHLDGVVSPLLQHLLVHYPDEMDTIKDLYSKTKSYGFGYREHRTIHKIREMAMKMGFIWTEGGRCSPNTVETLPYMHVSIQDIANAVAESTKNSFSSRSLGNKRTNWTKLLAAIHKGEARTNLSRQQEAALADLKAIHEGDATARGHLCTVDKYWTPIIQRMCWFIIASATQIMHKSRIAVKLS
ncbi:hypothetical protein BDN72DRAFT_864622 [Pluteus cervinus]|uniref:Uncharacterized protein n=1 Tax=Pluteus cervinus TaxID=181527 RepID=A0ACD3A378_9AGAR|nr:hypothetical protein BDN72DRAFT_864622 [Pluteus cervinus]